ncbi:hypothetical protein Fcan01_15596 [Folsomia candida]|uniref:Uncharacterized protein n=1 Tax=Folsomia candida TaxID=158441 RepID=A0A226DUH7_FOLCA|nr:hypothetical protein Fcan01_15596 [Folsomia candida]
MVSTPIVWRLATSTEFDPKVGKNFDFAQDNLKSDLFADSENNPMYQRLIGIVFRKVNISFFYDSYRLNLKSGATLGVHKIVTTLPTTNNPFWKATRQVVYKFQGYQFITCYSESFLSLKFYLVPFQPAVWGGFFMSMVTVMSALSLYQKLKNIQHFSPLWFILANIFDEGTHIPRRLENQEFFRILISGWILMVVILTNCYSGLMISDLNSPLPGTNVPTSFQDLVCEEKQIVDSYKERTNLTDWIFTYIEGRIQSKPEAFNNSCYQILSKRISSFTMFEYVSVTFGVRFELLSIWSSLFYEPRYIMDLVSLDTVTSVLLDKGNHKFIPGNFNDSSDPSVNMLSIEQDIAKCGKSVLFLEESALQSVAYYMSTKYFWIKFYKGNDILNLNPFGWTFEGAGISRVPLNFQALIESGIHGRLELKDIMKSYWFPNTNVVSRLRENPLGLDGAFITLFILCGVLIGASVFILIVELRRILHRAVLVGTFKISYVMGRCFKNFHIKSHFVIIRVASHQKSPQ